MTLLSPGPEDRDDRQGEDEGRDRHPDVEDPHQDEVHARGIPDQHADGHADDGRDDDRHEPERERQLSSEDDPGQDIAAELVRAERERDRRPDAASGRRRPQSDCSCMKNGPKIATAKIRSTPIRPTWPER